MQSNVSLRTGTTSGTLLSMVPNILSEDIIRTLILAAVGATASFIVTFILQRISRRKRK